MLGNTNIFLPETQNRAKHLSMLAASFRRILQLVDHIVPKLEVKKVPASFLLSHTDNPTHSNCLGNFD